MQEMENKLKVHLCSHFAYVQNLNKCNVAR